MIRGLLQTKIVSEVAERSFLGSGRVSLGLPSCSGRRWVIGCDNKYVSTSMKVCEAVVRSSPSINEDS